MYKIENGKMFIPNIQGTMHFELKVGLKVIDLDDDNKRIGVVMQCNDLHNVMVQYGSKDAAARIANIFCLVENCEDYWYDGNLRVATDTEMRTKVEILREVCKYKKEDELLANDDITINEAMEAMELYAIEYHKNMSHYN